MENEEIVDTFKLLAALMELHDENPFKIKSYASAAFNLDKLNIPLGTLSIPELEATDGIGKSLATKIHELCLTGTFPDLSTYLETTPPGVIEMLDIKGIGPKKVRTIWKELGIKNKTDLYKACEDNRIAELKGFGDKTQETIKQNLIFEKAQVGKLRYNEAEILAEHICKILKETFNHVAVIGKLARKWEVIDAIEIVVATSNLKEAYNQLNSYDFWENNKKLSSPFAWRGLITDKETPVEIILTSEQEFINQVFVNSSSMAHLLYPTPSGKTLLTIIKDKHYGDEKDIYDKAKMQYTPSELREGGFELNAAASFKLPQLVEMSDLKGILHNHSTFSDGKHTLFQMAERCKEMGYEYLGISDHSKSAQYAGGLYERKIIEQHAEIDKLNIELAPFKIFKGIESDILGNGDLDYDDYVLASFDFVVASIHSGLKMDVEKATKRLIKAIENPYTTILGHLTGRLILRRNGYPVDHYKIIDACAANGVVIEINASPWRLDMDWRYVNHAIQKGVMLSINPDAHEMDGYKDMYYGVIAGRKGGLTKEMTFNTFSLAEMENYLVQRKAKSNQNNIAL